jgi:lambda family phage portal protein
MADTVRILGANGQPLAPMQPSRSKMLAHGSRTPYDAAAQVGEHVQDWNPYLASPDGERNMYRDRITARSRDLVRNDGWASGAVTRILDNQIGGQFRPMFKPDYRALARRTGIKAFDATWAHEYAQVVEANYRAWADDAGSYADAQRHSSIVQLMRLAFRHKLIDGDALAQLLWLPDRQGPGRATYATALQLIDPDRLSNPQLQFDTLTMRGGVVVDRFGAATGYHIRRAHQGDWWSAADSMTWDLIPRETAWGRPIIVHDYDPDRAGQHKGGTGIFTPILTRMKMLAKMDGVELDAAVVNAVFGAYIESPYDHALVEEALGDESVSGLKTYQDERADFHQERRTSLGGVRMPILFPGEKINAVASTRPNANFAGFQNSFLRNFAAQTGLSAQQLSNNWSDVNYSSARAAMLEAYKTMARRHYDFSHRFASPIVNGWHEESRDVDEYPLPRGAPDFEVCRGLYGRMIWMKPARGWVDPVAEKQGAILGMDAALSTLQHECQEQDLDWLEVLEQRAIEEAKMVELGIEKPAWAGGVPAQNRTLPANESDKKPEPQ